MNHNDFIKMENTYGAHNHKPLDVVLSRAEGGLGRVMGVKHQKRNNPSFKEIRGRRLLIGLELLSEAGSGRNYCEKLMEKGVLCKETHDNIIRFAPPLIMTRDIVDWALERINKVLRQH